jgi:hypothetical protein
LRCADRCRRIDGCVRDDPEPLRCGDWVRDPPRPTGLWCGSERGLTRAGRRAGRRPCNARPRRRPPPGCARVRERPCHGRHVHVEAPLSKPGGPRCSN